MSARIFSIGYGGRTVENFAAALQQAGVKFVIDVRSSPNSKYQPDFCRDQLSDYLNSVGIKYVFMGKELGGRPTEDFYYTNGRVDYNKVKDADFYKAGLERLVKAYKLGLNICLMCSEARPSQCHRAKLIAASLEEIGMAVEHIMPNGTVQNQGDVISEITGGQSELFGEVLTSRKSYR